MMCMQPDKDFPESLTCGHSLPCPHHTIIVDAQDEVRISHTQPLSRRLQSALLSIGKAVKAGLREGE